jgi:hypothetical protein
MGPLTGEQHQMASLEFPTNFAWMGIFPKSLEKSIRPQAYYNDEESNHQSALAA